MAAVLQQRSIGHERRKRRRAHEPDTRNRLQALALCAGPVPGQKPFLDGGELDVEQRDRVEEARKRGAHHVRQCRRRGFADDLDEIGQLANALAGNKTELGQMAAQRVHQQERSDAIQGPRMRRRCA